MRILKEITAARKKLYLEALAEMGRYAEAVKAVGVSSSMLHYRRRAEASFMATMAAEDQAKEEAAKRM